MKINKGKWTRVTHFLSSDEYVCSVCRSVSKRPYKNCPACGSRMKRIVYDPHWVDEMDELDEED